MSSFVLHSQLAADTQHVTDLTLCRVLLMNDVRYPWLILVPQLPDITEIYQLSKELQHTLLDDVDRATKAILQHNAIDKINVAALGNMVPQLHIHVVGRRRDDEAWPAPVWGVGTATPYTKEKLSDIMPVYQGSLKG